MLASHAGGDRRRRRSPAENMGNNIAGLFSRRQIVQYIDRDKILVDVPLTATLRTLVGALRY